MFILIWRVNLKRLRYLVSAAAMTIGFYLYLSLPYEVKYWGLMVGVVLMVFCVWFGLGIVFEGDFYLRLMAVLLPVELFASWGLFLAMLPLSGWGLIAGSGVFGVWAYVIFLVENVFLVSVGFRRVPLYRAAYTVGLMMVMLASFLAFDTMWSFKLPFWGNFGVSFLIGLINFSYQFWAVAIELPDDGRSKNITAYIGIPSLLVAELALGLSFWPVGIFRGSIYLVAAVYILASLMQADIRERLFARVWRQYIWIGVAAVLGLLLTTRWR